jgi:hypothetical protein
LCIRYRGNVSTEPLPSNDKGIFNEPLPSNDNGIFTEPLPRNDKVTLTEPLPSNDRGDTHTHGQQRDLISLLYFLKIGKYSKNVSSNPMSVVSRVRVVEVVGSLSFRTLRTDYCYTFRDRSFLCNSS